MNNFTLFMLSLDYSLLKVIDYSSWFFKSKFTKHGFKFWILTKFDWVLVEFLVFIGIKSNISIDY